MTYPHRDFKMILSHPCSPLSVDWGGMVHGDGQLCVAASLERETRISTSARAGDDCSKPSATRVLSS